MLTAAATSFALLFTGAACTASADGSDAVDPGKAAAEQLRAATSGLTAAPAVRWTGSFPNASEHRRGLYTVDVRVAGNGALLGTVRNGTQNAEVMAVGGHTLLRGGENFWRWSGIRDGRLQDIGNRWVVMYDGFFDFDLGARLQPAALLGGTAPGATVTAGAVTAEGSEVQWNDVVYLIAADGPRLARLTTLGTAESPARLELRPAALDDAEQADLFGELRLEVKQLMLARDHGKQPDYAGQIPPAFGADEVARMSADLDRELEALR